MKAGAQLKLLDIFLYLKIHNLLSIKSFDVFAEYLNRYGCYIEIAFNDTKCGIVHVNKDVLYANSHNLTYSTYRADFDNYPHFYSFESKEFNPSLLKYKIKFIRIKTKHTSSGYIYIQKKKLKEILELTK